MCVLGGFVVMLVCSMGRPSLISNGGKAGDTCMQEGNHQSIADEWHRLSKSHGCRRDNGRATRVLRYSPQPEIRATYAIIEGSCSLNDFPYYLDTKATEQNAQYLTIYISTSCPNNVQHVQMIGSLEKSNLQNFIPNRMAQCEENVYVYFDGIMLCFFRKRTKRWNVPNHLTFSHNVTTLQSIS